MTDHITTLLIVVACLFGTYVFIENLTKPQ